MKTADNLFSRLMTMTDEVWDRHANPWSVWTRVVTGLPLILGAFWSVRLLGWLSLPVIFAVFFWIWINPRFFSRPTRTDNWASKVTFGERVWLNRKKLPIPSHHARWATVLSVVSGVGFLVAVYGAVQHQLNLTLLGGVVSWFGKMWFCDRMVWLFEDMKDTNATYLSWVRLGDAGSGDAGSRNGEQK
ncbi:DUF6653 family protein [Verrucomicrobiales bacterium BCK34]|nr:DUF6653 family protein [Verrucomicrobiales bacterium BCK34]